jgi:hypothetical protein
MKKRINRGSPLTELVKGSIEYTRHVIVRAFHKTFPSNWDYESGEWFNVEDTFAEFIVVSSSQLPIDEFYMVAYQRDGAKVTFAPREDWEVIELGYQLPGSQGGGGEPAPMSEQRLKRGSKFTETYASAVRLVEAKNKKKPGVPRVEAKLAEADVVNRNGRRYRRIVLRDAVEEARSHLHESFSQARAILTGEDAHPGDKYQRPMLREVVVVWDDVWFDESDGWVYIAGNVVETAVGKDVLSVMRAGVMPPISLRAYGESEQVKEGDETIDEVIWLRLTGADLVLEPGFAGAGVTAFQESANGGTTNEMDIEQLKQQLAEAQKELKSLREAKDKSAVDAAEARIKELQEAVKTAEATAKAAADKAAKLEEAEAQRQAELVEVQAKEQAAAAAAEKALRERLGIGPDGNLAEALAAEQKKLDEGRAKDLAREAATYVETAVAELPYPELYKDRVKAYIGEAATAEIAKTKLEEAKALFAPLVAKERLTQMGMGGNGRVQHIVPMIEAEANVPEFARAAYEITESMIAHNFWQPRQNRSQTSRAARFTKLYLEAFDKQFERQLAKEAHDWQEAMTTSQLNSPYSVLRAIVDEAFPQLVALSIFDVGTVDTNPTRVFYEAQYEAETGTNVTVTDESITADDDTWVNLANKRVDPSSIVARSAASGGGTLYTYGTDYVIDHTNGRFMNFADGAIADAATVYVSYTHKAIRKGEGLGIERARSKVAYEDLSLIADRLATEVTDEAIKFSRSQLGYDVVGRTINLLMKEVMRRIDSNLMHDALSRVLTVASNSGGTWASATDSEKEFLKKAGTARVKVENRFYTPEIMLMSKTNSDLISNADFFTAAGARPDTMLDEAGYVGRMKGLDVYASPVFTDAYALIHNRELLMYRTFGAMELKGPFPTYNSDRELVASEQYYIQQYNGYIAPIPGKGAYVKIS